MEDRFDRRELLLHLGDMLDAAHGLAGTSDPAASVIQRMQDDDSLQRFGFLRALAPSMTVAEFTQGVAGAFSTWPGTLLDAKLNRDALASAVQCNLFGDNVDGWNAYVSYLQTRVKWFGAGFLPMPHRDASGPALGAATALHPVETPIAAAPSTDANSGNEKRGWPWPDAR
ncbi:MAG TPA: hypothetical protein VFE79_02570 [Paraburkholderia sp.]|nr:hypothetical protein [Paraburkholderia sp.]